MGKRFGTWRLVWIGLTLILCAAAVGT
ncbi:MAG: hypothetical protein K0Q63_1953, partial [Paenibacillus sp.]|nr:hypothetical protein [Paenibacillus sp.]